MSTPSAPSAPSTPSATSPPEAAEAHPVRLSAVLFVIVTAYLMASVDARA
jgi:hypothetical protein